MQPHNDIRIGIIISSLDQEDLSDKLPRSAGCCLVLPRPIVSDRTTASQHRADTCSCLPESRSGSEYAGVAIIEICLSLSSEPGANIEQLALSIRQAPCPQSGGHPQNVGNNHFDISIHVNRMISRDSQNGTPRRERSQILLRTATFRCRSVSKVGRYQTAGPLAALIATLGKRAKVSASSYPRVPRRRACLGALVCKAGRSPTRGRDGGVDRQRALTRRSDARQPASMSRLSARSNGRLHITACGARLWASAMSTAGPPSSA